MNVTQTIKTAIQAAIQQLYQADVAAIALEPTNPKFVGDYTYVVFSILRISRKKPEDTATEIGEILKQKVAEIEDFNVVKGFLNLELSTSYWLNKAQELAKNPVAVEATGNGQNVAVEYSSPNTNKPLHLGHIRNIVLGYSYAQIMEAVGYKVYKHKLVNDRGIHICKSMLAWQKFGDGETPESSGIKGDHLVGKYYVVFDKAYKKQIADLVANGVEEEKAKEQAPLMQETRQMLQDWEAGKPEVLKLWKKMNGWVYDGFNATYNKLGVGFDKIYYESDTYLLGKEQVQIGLKNGVFYQEEDGSVWVDLEDEGLDKKILQRADGTSVYITQDIATALLKFDDFKADKSVYVVGNEQDYHFKVLALILKKLGDKRYKNIFHLSYGMVDLPEGKMKSREGTVVDADDLIEEVIAAAKEQTEELGKTEGMSDAELNTLYQTLGLGALKYFLLKVDAKKRMLFDPKESIQLNGDTGPFIQYAYTRIASLLRAAESSTFSSPDTLNQEELDLIKLLNTYNKTVQLAAKDANPAIVASFAYDLAKSFNKFYHSHSILGAEEENTKQFRIALSEATGKVLKHAFSLLGIEMPERM
jgi:arginyl-tRNA synthetase